VAANVGAGVLATWVGRLAARTPLGA